MAFILGVERQVDRPKVFCIGVGKTGTTSLEALFRDFGYKVGVQAQGEALLDAWHERNWAPIIELAKTAEFFQDVPFWLDGTYRVLDAAFPGSKFIHLTRDSGAWYESLTRFHTQFSGLDHLPTADDWRDFPSHRPGWMLDAMLWIYGVSEDDIYNRDKLIGWYEAYNAGVQQYFAGRPEALLSLSIAEPDAVERIAAFAGIDAQDVRMPHLNVSS